jgi:glutaminyl-tRNA synthetase
MSEERNLNFIEEIIEEDLKSGKYSSVVTRFPLNLMVICI